MMLVDLVKNQKVLFITTKNPDYIRNSQEMRILQKNAKSVEYILSTSKSYPVRIMSIYSSLAVEIIKKIFSKGKIYNSDIVFIGFAPQLILPVFKKAFRNRKIIIDFFISVYDTMVCDRKKFKNGSAISKLCHKLDEKTLNCADHIISDTKAHGKFFVDEFGADKEKLETLYLEADRSIYYPRPQNKPDELKDKFVVLYFGSILPLQGVDVVLDAIRQLKDEANVFFDVIGPIPDKYNKPIQDNVRYTEWLPQEELAVHIANADLCLAGHFNGNIEKANRTIPGKTYIYSSMKKKMILGDNQANKEKFKKDFEHIFIRMGDAYDLVAAIKKQHELLTEQLHG